MRYKWDECEYNLLIVSLLNSKNGVAEQRVITVHLIVTAWNWSNYPKQDGSASLGTAAIAHGLAFAIGNIRASPTVNTMPWAIFGIKCLQYGQSSQRIVHCKTSPLLTHHLASKTGNITQTN